MNFLVFNSPFWGYASWYIQFSGTPKYLHHLVTGWPWPVVLTQALLGAVSLVARPAAGAELRRQCGARAEKPGAARQLGALRGSSWYPNSWLEVGWCWMVHGAKKYGSDWRSRNSNLAWAFVPFWWNIFWLVVSNYFFSIIYGINPYHWLIFFKMVKTTNQYRKITKDDDFF